MPNFKGGDIVRFTYISPDAPAGARTIFKEVFVLNPLWNGKMHGIDLKRLTEAQRVVLKTIMKPEAKRKTHRIPLINDVLRRMDPPTLIQNPVSFYNQFVKQFLKNIDAYRTYYTARMSGIQVTDMTKAKGPVINPKPLFGPGDGGNK